ncbi:MAG: M14 family metallopeptidase [Candidatus Bathyarchaeota archaeon]|nr:M14 family metallopeptidase [Candidatus Bathyarchaeota archaeon]
MTKNTPPETFFGHQLGADRKIARWDKIVEYFMLLETESPRIKVMEMGPTTEGNPFLAVMISSEENLANLDRLQEVNKKIADPEDVEPEEAEKLVAEGKAVVIQSMSLHATEIGGTQMSPELAYDLLTREDEEAKRIRDEVISIMVPSFNPDGQIMVTDWYNEWLDTDYEGCSTPFLYHKYCGHDNNRDAFMLNTIESNYMAELMFRAWPPQAYQDHHHMGSYGARLYVSPYSDPIHPHGDPLVWRELQWYGSHMAYKLEEEGKQGIVNASIFSGWAHLGYHWIGIYHNIPSMLTESASAKLATPLYIHPEQLKAETKESSLVGTRMLPHYKPTTNFPNPWPGGWWTLRDIVEQQKISAWALLDQMARNRETVLWNQYQKAVRQTERGLDGSPQVLIVPEDQHDPRTMELMIQKLTEMGVKLYKAMEPFTADGYIHGTGSYLIPLAQPKMGLLMTLLTQTRFPDDSFTRRGDGTPHRPYDTATDTMAEFMGVSVHPADYMSNLQVEPVTGYKKPVGYVDEASKIGYLLDTRENHAYKAVNMLLKENVPIKRITEPIMAGDLELPAGCFIVEPGYAEKMTPVAEEVGVDFHALAEIDAEMKPVKALKVGMYDRFWGGNMDTGWTRLCLEQYAFDYDLLFDEDILEGDLDEYDVIIFAHDSPEMITGGEELQKWWKETRPDWPLPVYPPEYESGLGEEGKKKLAEWTKKGGTLLCIGGSCQYAIDALKLPITNVVKGLNAKEFHCPGSTLRVNIENTHPAAYGMPDEALALFWSSPAFKINPGPDNHLYEVVAYYPESDLLESGWLVGEDKLVDKIAAINSHVGEGNAVLMGPRIQHRCQTHGTFKLLFNSLLG